MASVAEAREQIVILAPLGADSRNIATVLKKAGFVPAVCTRNEEAALQIKAGAGALLVTEEALAGKHPAPLIRALAEQPLWSDIPMLIVTSDAMIDHWAKSSAELLGPRSNVTLIARPLQRATLIAAVAAVLRARRRQYEIRDLLREREALLGSLEARVKERTARLQELVAELEAFSYSVSHDLRAPLRVMAGYASVVLEDFAPALPADARDYIERIAKSAERLDRLTRDVLAYTRITRDEIKLGPVNVGAIVEETIDQYPELAKARQSISLQRPLAPVLAHGPSLVQILSNLLGNAVKFGRPNIPLRIEVSTRARGRRIRIVVKDNGVGLERRHHARVFRMFERVAGREIPGTGIGLAIVKKAAERMGGAVGVKSKLGFGSEFWIELPRALSR